MIKLLNKPENESEMANADFMGKHFNYLIFGVSKAMKVVLPGADFGFSILILVAVMDIFQLVHLRDPVLGIDSSIKEFKKRSVSIFTNFNLWPGWLLASSYKKHRHRLSTQFEHISDGDSVIREISNS